MKITLFSLILLMSTTAYSDRLISQSVAEVNGSHLTSRQVILTTLLSKCLKSKCNSKVISTNIKSEAFADMLSKSIFERLAFYEAEGVFEKITPLSWSVINKITVTSLARKLQFQLHEIKNAYRVKALAKKYIEFKDKNLSVYITDNESKNFYLENKLKYKDKGYKSVAPEIKKILQARRKRKRVEDWVSNMQSKYRVKQFLN